MNTTLLTDEEVTRMREAADWLIRLDETPGDEAAVSGWLQWCEANPRNLPAFQRAQGVWHGAAARPAAIAQRARPRRLRPRMAVAWAASVVLAAVGGFWFTAQREAQTASQTYLTPVGGTGGGVLPDGSKVELGARSHITTRYSASARSVTVDAGEAYFVVARDPDRPFVVMAGGVQVTAIGTAFNVRRGGDRVVVAVREGKVNVAGVLRAGQDRESSPQAADLVPLAAGQQAVYQADARRIAVGEIQPEDAASWRHGVLKYLHEPLSAVAEDLSRYSRRPIVVPDSQLARRPFTGTVFSSRVDDALKALEDVFALQVVEREDRIELTPRP